MQFLRKNKGPSAFNELKNPHAQQSINYMMCHQNQEFKVLIFGNPFNYFVFLLFKLITIQNDICFVSWPYSLEHACMNEQTLSSNYTCFVYLSQMGQFFVLIPLSHVLFTWNQFITSITILTMQYSLSLLIII